MVTQKRKRYIISDMTGAGELSRIHRGSQEPIGFDNHNGSQARERGSVSGLLGILHTQH